MAEADFERLRAMVDDDDSLQAELWQIHDAHRLISTIVRIAAQRGLAIAEGELWERHNASQSAWLAIWSP